MSDSATRPTPAAKRQAFHRLHDRGCFVIPNPWDAGSARYLESLGFQALAFLLLELPIEVPADLVHWLAGPADDVASLPVTTRR